MKLNELHILREGEAELEDLIDDAMFVREIRQSRYKEIHKAVLNAYKNKDIETITKVDVVNIIDDLDLPDDHWNDPDDDDEAGSDYDWNESNDVSKWIANRKIALADKKKKDDKITSAKKKRIAGRDSL